MASTFIFVLYDNGEYWDIVLHLQSAVSVDCLCSSRSPLHYAAANCNYQCLFALVGSGASVNDLDKRGCTPLHYAAASDTDGKYVSHSSYCCVCCGAVTFHISL